MFFEGGVPRINKKNWREKGIITADTAMFDSMIVRYLPGKWSRPVLNAWKVPPHVTPYDLDRARERLEAA